MSYVRLPYADAETPHAMSTDAFEAGTHLQLPGQRSDGAATLLEDTAHPSFASSVDVPDSLARLAGEMALHFD